MLVSGCSFDPAWLNPRPQELQGEEWANVTARHVWAVLPEPPRWKKDIAPTGIRGTAVVVGEGQFLTACALVRNERAIGLARVNKYYVGELIGRSDDGACLLFAEDPPVNLPEWRRTTPPSGIFEPAILLTSIDQDEIDAQTTTIVGDRVSAGPIDERLASVAFDRFGAVLGIAVREPGGGLRLIGSEALGWTDLARLHPTSPQQLERDNGRFTVAVDPEISPPERRPTAFDVEPDAGHRENDDGLARAEIDRIEAALGDLSASEPSDGDRKRGAARDNPSRESRSHNTQGREDRDRRDQGRNDRGRDERDRSDQGQDNRGGNDQGRNDRGRNDQGRDDD